MRLVFVMAVGLAACSARITSGPRDEPQSPDGSETSGDTGVATPKVPNGDARGADASIDVGSASVTAECLPADFIIEPNCAVRWSAIFPKTQATGAWKCASAGCHFDTNKPILSGNPDAKKTWDIFRAHKSTDGVPYINPCSKDPAASYIVANLQGKKGTLMPLTGALQPSEIADVETWSNAERLPTRHRSHAEPVNSPPLHRRHDGTWEAQCDSWPCSAV